VAAAVIGVEFSRALQNEWSEVVHPWRRECHLHFRGLRVRAGTHAGGCGLQDYEADRRQPVVGPCARPLRRTASPQALGARARITRLRRNSIPRGSASSPIALNRPKAGRSSYSRTGGGLSILFSRRVRGRGSTLHRWLRVASGCGSTRPSPSSRPHT